jgi:hypothetical protein
MKVQHTVQFKGRVLKMAICKKKVLVLTTQSIDIYS